MADQGDTYDLLLNVDATPVAKAEQVVDQAEAEIYKFGTVTDVSMKTVEKSMQRAATETYHFADEVRHLTQEEARELVTTMVKADQGVGKLSGSLSSARGGVRDMGRATLEGARALEDLQYGIGGIVNNVPGLVMAVGGTMGMAGLFNVLLVGANQLVKHWDDVERAFSNTYALPEAADKTRILSKELDTARQRMEELEKAGHGTAGQIEEYNKLTAETVRLEKAITTEKEKQARIKAVQEVKTDEETDFIKRRKEIAQDFVAENKEQLIAALAESSRRGSQVKYEQAMEDMDTFRGKDAAKFNEAFERAKQYDVSRKDTAAGRDVNRKHAMDIIGKLLEGDLGALELIRGANARDGFGDQRRFPYHTENALGTMTPEFMRASDQRKAREKKAEDDKKEADKLSKEEDAERKQRSDQYGKEIDERNKRLSDRDKEIERNKKAEQADLSKRVAESGRHTAEVVHDLESGGLEKQAAAMAATLRAQGGALDAQGRFRRMDADQQRAALTQALVGQIQAQRPDLSLMQAMGAATAIAAHAQQDVNKRLTSIGFQGLSAQERLVNVAGSLNAEVAQLGLKQNDVQRRVADLERRVQARNNLNRGAVR